MLFAAHVEIWVPTTRACLSVIRCISLLADRSNAWEKREALVVDHS